LAFKDMLLSHGTSLRNTHILHYPGYVSKIPSNIGVIYSFVFMWA